MFQNNQYNITMATPVVNMTSDENAAVGFIRNELRDELNLSRKQQRSDSLNKKRMSLGTISGNDELTVELVTAMAQSLKKKPLKSQEYIKLQNALIQSENHINAFFKVNNAIHGLIRDLSGTSDRPKLAAANCCCNLALGNEKACFTLCKFAAPYLIAELESVSQPLVEACAWTIGNLSSESDKAFCILHAQGCMKSLINLAQQCSDELLPAVSYACVRYIHKGINSIDVADIVNLGIIVSQRYPAVSDTDTMWLLAIMSSIPECFQCLMICLPRICDYLLEAVSNDDSSIQKISAALRIVCNMVSEPSGQVAHYLLRGDNEKNYTFLDKLLRHQYIHIRQEALWLLGNLFRHHLDTVKQLVMPIISSLPLSRFITDSFHGVT